MGGSSLQKVPQAGLAPLWRHAAILVLLRLRRPAAVRRIVSLEVVDAIYRKIIPVAMLDCPQIEVAEVLPLIANCRVEVKISRVFFYDAWVLSPPFKHR